MDDGIPLSERLRRPERRWLVAALAAAAAIVVCRSLVFLLRPHVAFDSDQAVIGLMAKHLSEGRAFPLFMYGQSYILAVEAWMAAPVFLAAGVSIAALKLPLLAVNAVVGVLLVWRLVRETRIPPAAALVASLFFLLPPPGTAAALLESGGGNVEPLLYVVLLWLLRSRPGWFGLVAAIGILHREFTAYGLVAFVGVGLATGELRTRAAWRPLLAGLRVTAELWLVIQWLSGYSSAMGPGTTTADLGGPTSNLLDIAGRFCIDPGMFGAGLARIATVHWAALFGTARYQLTDLGVVSGTAQGLPGLGWLLSGVFLLMLARILVQLPSDENWRRCAFPLYLTAVGALSALVYALGRCGDVALPTMRYDLLSILGAVGLAACFLAVERRPWVKGLAAGAIVLWATAGAASHVRLWSQQAHALPTDKQRIVAHLQARGARYVVANYWTAYYTTFVTQERIIATAEDASRILEYDRILARHRAEAVHIQWTPCEGGFMAMRGVYFCSLP